MTPAMQAARDRVVEAAKAWGVTEPRSPESKTALTELAFDIHALLALEAQEKEQADAR